MDLLGNKEGWHSCWRKEESESQSDEWLGEDEWHACTENEEKGKQNQDHTQNFKLKEKKHEEIKKKTALIFHWLSF